MYWSNEYKMPQPHTISKIFHQDKKKKKKRTRRVSPTIVASKSGRYTLWDIGNSSTGNIIRTQIRITNPTRSGSPSRNITLRFRKIRTRKIIKRLLTKIAIFTEEIEKSNIIIAPVLPNLSCIHLTFSAIHQSFPVL